MNKPNLDSLIDQITAGLPSGLRTLTQETENNLKAAVRSTLRKMDLVTREEFEIQRDVLARTRAKLEILEKQVAELEAKTRD